MDDTNFIAHPKDDTLEATLSEAFAAIERRFRALDHDKAGIFTFKTLELQLSANRLANMNKLAELYKTVDKDGNGTLDFSEYLALLYLWVVHDQHVEAFFAHPQNAGVVAKAFRMMESKWLKYDADRSRKLSIGELSNLMAAELPNLWANSQGKIAEFYPESDRAAGMGFSKYMHLLYACLHAQPGNSIPGNYTKPVVISSNQGGKDSSAWQAGVRGFKALETDFDRYDSSKDGYLELTELTRAFPIRTNAERLAIQSRLQGYYLQVDADNSKTLDFFEFIYLSFLMSLDGSYADLVPGAAHAHEVKLLFLRFLEAYKKADSSGDFRLSKTELSTFFNTAFGVMPTEAEGLFDKFAYESSKNPGQKVLDIVRLLKVVYTCLIPDLKFPSDRYTSAGKPARDNAKYVINSMGSTSAAHPPRVNPVQNSRFQKQKQLGKGGQGEVWLGQYDGMKVAGKTMSGPVTPDIIQDLQNEVQLLTHLDHPHCHFMIGCKLNQDGEGGPLLLTEVCDEGSLWDLYTEKGYVFPDDCAWRLAKECAAGFEALHNLGYMHRDIKSMNVFMAAGFVAKVADFGMATNKPLDDMCGGTPMWMAPEVWKCGLQPGSRPYDKRCDIYSYAILVWEIYHCQIPYADYPNLNVGNAVLAQQMRPAMSGMRLGRGPVPPGIPQFIQACWAQDPNQRPQSFGHVLEMLAPLKPAGMQ